MRISDWIVRILIFLLIATFLYMLLFVALPQYRAIENQRPNRQSVSETLQELDNGKKATLDPEDMDDDSFDGIGKTIKEGAGAVGDQINETAGAAKDALSSTSRSIQDRAKGAIASTPSIDDLVSLKEEQAKEFEAQSDKEVGRGAFSPTGSTPNGDYMVVAGTYRQMINAESELKKLKNLGYQNATIAKFNKSTYASLLVDRFSTSAAAYKYKKTLEQKGLDVYVHKKR